VDIFQKCAESAKYYALVRDEGIYPYYRAISSGQDPVVTHMGEELIMLGSNNYLGLTNHPEVKEAATVALAMFGTGCAGSRFSTARSTFIWSSRSGSRPFSDERPYSHFRRDFR